jgi:hypothetical protein
MQSERGNEIRVYSINSNEQRKNEDIKTNQRRDKGNKIEIKSQERETKRRGR